MGLFNFIKKQLLKVIEWKDNSKDTIVYHFPITDREEIMTSSTLVVRESQAAIFVHKGKVADVFGPGTYKLQTENIPFLTKLLSLPTGFESPIKADVYYVNTKQFVGQKWGTQNPIMMRDADFGNIRLRGFGVYSYKVEDPKTFMNEIFGTNEVYTVSDMENQIKPLLVQCISDAIGESKISALDLAANYKEFGYTILTGAQEEFNKLGLKLCTFIIENLSLPEEVEKMLDERTKMGVMEDKMGTYTQYQAAQALRDAAQNEGGNNFAGLGIGLGAGTTIGGMFANGLSTENKEKPEKVVDSTVCSKCGAKIKKGVKFCPECGESQVLTCPKCGKEISKNTKFCTECGENLNKELVCSKCGAKMKKDAKFCPECGQKVE